MGENSNIEWTDHTFNPWRGCTKVHAGCTNCYAEVNYSVKMHGIKWGPNGTRVVAADSGWEKPVAWNRQAEAEGVRRKVFCASLADVFEDWQGPMLNAKGEQLFTDDSGSVPITMAHCRQRLFSLIDATPWLDWILVTKRPENIRRMWGMKTDFRPIFPGAPGKLGAATECMVSQARRSNVWLLTSVSDQASADKQIPELLKCRDLAPVLGISAEPLLGPIDLQSTPDPLGDADWKMDVLRPYRWRNIRPAGPVVYPDWRHVGRPWLDWVIVGGESGPHARPMHPDWARSIRDQCVDAGVPFFFKQGSKAGWSDFKNFDSFPPELRLRQFPEAVR